MECDKGIMPFTPSKEIISSHMSSLGGGDTSFQSIFGVQTEKLSFSSSPVQIFRQRYWCKPPQRKPFSFVSRYGKQSHSALKEVRTLHMSLEDLSEKVEFKIDDARRHSTPYTVKRQELCSQEKNSDQVRNQAARRIYEALMLNAWRKRKEDTQELIKMIHNLTFELDSQKMKLNFLRNFLKKEAEKREQALAEISVLNSKLQEKNKALEEMRKEKERMVLEFEDALSHERTHRTNTKNELIQVKNEQLALEVQLEKEREKLIKLRGEMEIVIIKVDDLENTIISKNHIIERLKEINLTQKESLSTLELKTAEGIAAERSRCEELQAEKTNLSKIVADLEEVKIGLEEEILRMNDEAKAKDIQLSSQEKELNQQERKHEIQMKNVIKLLSDVLHERRKFEAMSEHKESEFIVMAKRFFREARRLPQALLYGITYAIWPYQTFGSMQRPAIEG